MLRFGVYRDDESDAGGEDSRKIWPKIRPHRRQYLNITALLAVPVDRLIHVGAMPHICSEAFRCFRRTRHINNSPKPHYLAHQLPIAPEKIMNINRFRGSAAGRNRCVEHAGIVYAVATAPGDEIKEQTRNTLAHLDESLKMAGSDKTFRLQTSIHCP